MTSDRITAVEKKVTALFTRTTSLNQPKPQSDESDSQEIETSNPGPVSPGGL